MDEFRLRVFVTAARTLSFSKCAAVLNITQPAVSRHIGELEARYGMPLFSRGTSGVTLTKAGELLLSHETSQGRLSIGASTTIAMYLLPPVLAAFMERSGGVEVSMLSGNSENVEQWLRDGTVDIGFVENASRRPWLHYEPLMADELVLVAGTQGRYGTLESVTLDERALGQHGLRVADLRVVIELSSTEAIKAFVRSSDTLAIVSVIALHRELADGSLRIVDIDGIDMPREFATVVRPGEFSGLNARFHDFVIREAGV